MKPLSRAQARRIDQLASEELGISSIVLMENAGLNATLLIRDYVKTTLNRELADTPALIVCGGGNNGGDGYVVARHLHNRGALVQIIAHKPIEQLTADAAINAHICQQMNLPIHPTSALSTHISAPSVVIDALLGTGFQGSLRPDLLQLIQHINATKTSPHPPAVISLDLPSGLDCDTGQPPGQPPGHPAQDAIHADLTITFLAPKLGFSGPAAKPYLGQVMVADIGVPPELIVRVRD